MKEVMSWPNAMKEHLPGLVSPGFSSASKDPSKESKKRPIQCTRKNGVDEDGSAEKKSRLTVEQIKFLEASFNSDIKLEPERKALIAKQLSLRPRQVAIWFQNRRARWKNKQVEHEYEMLKASYEAVEKEKENLMKDYEVALEGNKRLQAEVVRLTSLLQSIKDKDVRNNLPPTNEEQLSDKSELMSPTKSAMDEQSEVEDLVMPSDVNEAAATGTSIEELDSAIACATRLEGENAPYLPSYVILSSLPVLVQQLIANGYGLEDAMHIFWNCEDTFGSGFTLYESS